ncbi:MAG: hypothetical protein HYU36_09800 [Planctomycetes bacterium]|nr:hypothetical protein [Planctomycetota bacterium]
MKRVAWEFILAVAWPLAHVSADSLQLKDGGKLEGTLEQIVLADGGKSLGAADLEKLQDIHLSAEKDQIVLQGGQVITGRIQSLVLKTVGGRQTLARDRIAAYERKASKANEAVQELRKRQAALAADDAEGHYQLGVWARSVKLSREANGLFQKSLEINPSHPFADQAHGALGHKKVNEEWVAGAAAAAATSAETSAKPSGGELKPEVLKRVKMVEIVESALKQEIEDSVASQWVDAEKEVSRIQEAISTSEETKSAEQNSLAVDRLTNDERKEKHAAIEKLGKEMAKLQEELKAAEGSLARQKAKFAAQTANQKKELKSASTAMIRRLKAGEAVAEDEIEGVLRREAKIEGEGTKATAERIAKMKEEVEAGLESGGAKKAEATADRVKEKQEKEAKLKRDMELLNSRIEKLHDEADRAHPSRVEYVLIQEEKSEVKFFNDGGKQWRDRTKKCQEAAQKCLELVKLKVAAVKKNRELFADEMSSTEALYKELTELQEWLEKHKKVTAPPSELDR